MHTTIKSTVERPNDLTFKNIYGNIWSFGGKNDLQLTLLAIECIHKYLTKVYQNLNFAQISVT